MKVSFYVDVLLKEGRDLRSGRKTEQEVGRKGRDAVFELGARSDSKRSRFRVGRAVGGHLEES